MVAHIPPARLYRYRPDNTDYFVEEMERAIVDRSLYLVRQRDLNDPFEALPHVAENSIREIREYLTRFQKIFGKGIAITGTDFRKIAKELNVPKKTKLAMFGPTVECANETRKYLKVAVSKIRQATKAACLSERWDSMLMWSHYSNSHKGVCVEYAPILDISAKEKIAPLAIQYLSDRPTVTMLDIMEHIAESKNENVDDFFDAERVQRTFDSLVMTKAVDWEYEREWRVIQIGDEPSGYCRVAALEPKSILLGVNHTEKTRNMVVERFAGKVDVETVSLDERRFALKRERLR